MYNQHTNCRACGYGPSHGPGGIKSASPTDALRKVLDLGIMPLPNAFKKANEPRPGHYPVKLMACPRCSLGQLSATVDPLVMYADYPYITSTSQTMLNHFENLWAMLNQIKPIQSVVEIGSNDGRMLRVFQDLGATAVMGIDPAANLASIAEERGVSTITSLFDRNSSEMAKSCMPKIDLVIARHVFCHVDDWKEFINNVAVLCDKETIVCIEVPYALDMIQKVEWDTVYAEHTSYLTLKAMEYLLQDSMLKLHDVRRFDIHGGAIGVILVRKDSNTPMTEECRKMIDSENCDTEAWDDFASNAMMQIAALRDMVIDLRAAGKEIAGYGASAKSTVWINACGFNRSQIRFIVDDTPMKQYCTTPGTDIPIVDPGAILRERPDYVILWAWNFEKEILEKESRARELGVNFIIPTAPIRIVSATGESF